MLQMFGFWILLVTFFGVMIAAHYAQVCAKELKGIREHLEKRGDGA